MEESKVLALESTILRFIDLLVFCGHLGGVKTPVTVSTRHPARRRILTASSLLLRPVGEDSHEIPMVALHLGFLPG